MSYLTIAAVIVVGYLIFRFIVKPIFKIIGFVALALIAWWVLGSFH
ncbi:hypothetical protein KW798_03465 [Candidatus Parcubacteria bacterium]|nr:hypothetical protein [Candidatus Parcubacteria bacterium]